MKEARIGQIVILKTKTLNLEGLVDNVEHDRIVVNYFARDREKFKSIKEGEMLRVLVHTKFGVKKMKSMAIEQLQDQLVIENAPVIPEVENREDVRTIVNMKIFIKANKMLIPAVTLDLSAGGVKFELKNTQIPLDVNTQVDVKFIGDAFERDMSIGAIIIKVLSDKIFVARFIDGNENTRSKISSFCMRNMD